MSHLQKNLAALAPHTPITAALIAAANFPEGFLPAVGTDGSPTFLRISSPPKQLDWLGQTSMPAASAAPLIAALEPGTTSGLGLSIATAHEWLAFLQKLAPSQTLYLYEPDPALLKMALTICDLSPHLAAAKIVLLTGTAADLDQFLASHLGHEPPTVLHPLPTIPPERRNLLVAAAETIVRQALHTRQLQTNTLAAQLPQLEHPTSNAVAFFATPRYPGERPHPLPAGTPSLYLDRHDSASLTLRLQFLLQHRPHTLLSDFFRHQLTVIPASIPVHTFIPPLVGPAFWQPARLPNPQTFPSNDRIIVHAHTHQLLLLSHGIPMAQITLQCLSAENSGSKKSPPPAATATTKSLALLADLPRTDAASLGLVLPTHEAVHAAAIEAIAADYLTVTFHSAPDILRRALAKAGVTDSSDPSLQDPMLRLIRDVLIPAIPLLTLARILLDQQIPLLLLGDWPNLDRTGPLLHFEPFTPSATFRWQNTAAILHLSPWGNVSPIILDAYAQSIPLVAPRHPSDAFPGSLPTILPPHQISTAPSPSNCSQASNPCSANKTRRRPG